MSHFDVLNRDSKVLTRRFLEASAGTGKTFAIEHLAIRLILESERPLSLDQILVVTFTRAATRELKMRIRLNLEKALSLLKGQSGGPDYLTAIYEKGQEAVKDAIRKLEEAIFTFDNAQVFTIHGFCHRMLSEYAFEAEISYGVNDPDANEHQGYLRQAVIDFFRTRFSLPAYSPRQILAVLRHHKYDIERLSDKLVFLLEKEARTSSLVDFQALFEKFKKVLLSLNNSLLEKKILEDFKKLAPSYKKMTDPERFEQMQFLAKLLEKGTCDLEEFDTLIKDKEHVLEFLIPKNLKVKAKLPDDAALNYPHLFKTLQKEVLPIILEATDPRKLLLRMVNDCQTLLSLHFKEKLSPDQILKKMQECLQKTSFKERVQNRYRVAIIDEFQDTDSIQWSIFKQLFLNSDYSMDAIYLVGDPKQSIYAFRHADVYTYLKAIDALGETSRSYLNTNFRSDPSLVHAMNALFSNKNVLGWLSLPKKKSSLDYIEVLSSSKNIDRPIADGKGKIHFFIQDAKMGREKKWPNAALEEDFLFPFIAQEIETLSKMHGFSLSKIAVLIKDRFQGQRLQEFLKKFKIPASLKKSGSLLETTAYIALRELLDAALDPDDLGKLKAVLGGPLIAWDQKILEKTLESPVLQSAKAQLLTLNQAMQKKGFGAFFQEFLLTKFDERSVLEKLVSQENLDLYQNLNQLAELLIEQESNTSFNVDALAFFLKELKKRHDDDERIKIKNIAAVDAVNIMTTHMSKGLEFDIVFALGLASRHQMQEEFHLFKDEDAYTIEEFDIENEKCKEHVEELDAEKLRQLYVAFTRAKCRLYVPSIFNIEEKEVSLGAASPTELFLAKLLFAPHESSLYDKIPNLTCQLLTSYLDGFKNTYSISYSTGSQKLPEHVSTTVLETILEEPIPFEAYFKKEYMHSFTSLAKKSSADGAKEGFDATEASKSVHTMVLGAGTGIVLHCILEKLFSKKHYFPYDQEKVFSLICHEIKGSDLEGWERPVFEMIEKCLKLPLLNGDNAFCLLDLKPYQVRQEMEFLISMPDAMIKGFADLVFEKDGKYYLLDWKSNWLGPSDANYDQTSMKNVMDGNDYHLQAAIYSTALERYVKLFDNRPFDECFGGAFYVFLRGCSVFHFIPDRSLVDGIDFRNYVPGES